MGAGSGSSDTPRASQSSSPSISPAASFWDRFACKSKSSPDVTGDVSPTAKLNVRGRIRVENKRLSLSQDVGINRRRSLSGSLRQKDQARDDESENDKDRSIGTIASVGKIARNGKESELRGGDEKELRGGDEKELSAEELRSSDTDLQIIKDNTIVSEEEAHLAPSRLDFLTLVRDEQGEQGNDKHRRGRVQNGEERGRAEGWSDSVVQNGDGKANEEEEDVGKIKAIDKLSIHRICSGQVILDLATAVKEVVENSIDAGATAVTVRFVNHGLDKFEVIDNGSGVDPASYETICHKYTTSKLREFVDLESVRSFGFRGEALSSLCAVADLTILTRTSRQDVGCKLTFDRTGLLESKVPAPRGETGTTVTVCNLFESLPVRRREFEGNAKKEFGKMQQLLQAYALIAKGIEEVEGVLRDGRW